jgi:hypothetical protein
MATNTRIRIDADIEVYIRSQSERVMGIASDKLTAADLTTLTNRILYEHKLAQTMMRQEFVPRLFSWLKGILPGLGGNTDNGKVVAIASYQQPQPALPEISTSEDSGDAEFLEGFASQFEEAS